MPRVTVNRDTSAVTPLPTPELVQPEPAHDIPLTDQQADTLPPVEPVQPAPPVHQIIRQIKTVLIEVPLCDNPPGLDGTPSFTKAHVNLQLIKSRSPTGRHLLHRLFWGLKETGAKLANGRKVFNRNDAVVWLIEQLEERS
ncbi:MAG TPA: hypothetical protein PLF81_15220 [Candidatus Anammoximicrobium sp.]|nr:hypothetical protein [Candidatus Anammoximicrobium sp.]